MRFAVCLCALLCAAAPALAVEPRLRDSPAPSGLDRGPALIASDIRIEYDAATLPAPVARLRQQLIDIARSGDVEGLAAIIEGNDIVPKFSFGDDSDPIAFWKEISGDGEGREVLAILLEVLLSGFVATKDEEGALLYVWPYFAEIPITGLTPKQEVELYMLVTAQDRRDMEDFGAYNFFRLGIRGDGQWQYFIAGD